MFSGKPAHVGIFTVAISLSARFQPVLLQLFSFVFESLMSRPGAVTPIRMKLPVTFPTESDEVSFHIVTQPTAGGDVVNFQSHA